MKPRNRRNRYWIDSEFQGRYLRRILLLEIFAVALTAVPAPGIALLLVSDSFQVGPQWWQIFLAFAAMAVAAAGGLVWLGVRVSHQICGPIYNIKRTLDAIQCGGPVGPIRLREGDAFQDLADSFNEVLVLINKNH